MQLGKITLTAVGKLKKDHWRAAQAEYVKRLKPYTTFTIKEIRDYVGKGMPDEVAVNKESNDLLAVTKDIPFRIALAIHGQPLDSLEFARSLQQWIEDYSHIAFLIGGPLGFSSEVIEVCDYQLSMSSFTLPHELARIVLLEQLYRAATILSHHQYHK